MLEVFYAANQDVFSQLIFTALNTELLNFRKFLQDNIWFTNLNQYGETELYSLLEFKGVEETDNFAKGYVLGKFGAIPSTSRDLSVCGV